MFTTYHGESSVIPLPSPYTGASSMSTCQGWSGTSPSALAFQQRHEVQSRLSCGRGVVPCVLPRLRMNQDVAGPLPGVGVGVGAGNGAGGVAVTGRERPDPLVARAAPAEAEIPYRTWSP